MIISEMVTVFAVSFRISLILTDAALRKYKSMLHLYGQPFWFIFIEYKNCHCLLKQIAMLVLEM